MSMELMNRLNAHTSKMMRPTTGFSRKIYPQAPCHILLRDAPDAAAIPREACGMRMNVSIMETQSMHEAYI